MKLLIPLLLISNIAAAIPTQVTATVNWKAAVTTGEPIVDISPEKERPKVIKIYRHGDNWSWHSARCTNKDGKQKVLLCERQLDQLCEPIQTLTVNLGHKSMRLEILWSCFSEKYQDFDTFYIKYLGSW